MFAASVLFLEQKADVDICVFTLIALTLGVSVSPSGVQRHTAEGLHVSSISSKWSWTSRGGVLVRDVTKNQDVCT